jgi:hypothetical protein
MGKYLDAERPRQLAWWAPHAVERSLDPRHAGKYPFRLPKERAGDNLYPPAAEAIQGYFVRHQITWHRERGHLCSSQVACLNFLFPLGTEPEALADLLRSTRAPGMPGIRRALEIDPGSESPYVAFEYIGPDGVPLIGEGQVGRKRTRGANCTSADAAVLVETEDGHRELLLIEWKLTESYSSTPLRYSKSKTDRCAIYENAREEYAVLAEDSPTFESYFYEPTYQLLRQQLLAAALEKHRVLGAERVRVVHISPAINHELHRVTSPALQVYGDDVFEVWRSALARPDRFVQMSTGAMFTQRWAARHPSIAPWWDYVSRRYESALRLDAPVGLP